MDEFIKILDKNLKYLTHEIIDDTIYIHIESIRNEVQCPFCGHMSSKAHSTYERSFNDLPMQGKKVKIIIKNRKMFCNNPDCAHTTFAERFDWVVEIIIDKTEPVDIVKPDIIKVQKRSK